MRSDIEKHVFGKNFHRVEFACNCGCGFDTPDAVLLYILRRIRDHFGCRLHITSACRCPTHNKSVGGKDRSFHLLGQAADFWVAGVSPQDVAEFIEEIMPNWGGMKVYIDRIHLDVRRGYWREY